MSNSFFCCIFFIGDDSMLFKFYMISFLFLILNVFVDSHFFPFHTITLVIIFQLRRWQTRIKDVHYVFVLWMYKLLLLFCIKKDAFLWVIYDVFCLCLSIYFLLKALKNMFVNQK